MARVSVTAMFAQQTCLSRSEKDEVDLFFVIIKVKYIITPEHKGYPFAFGGIFYSATKWKVYEVYTRLLEVISKPRRSSSPL